MTLRPVDSTVARVASHRSARSSRGYKLSREGTDPRSLGGVFVVARCVCRLSEVYVRRSEVCVRHP
jgi:hypothetical protein